MNTQKFATIAESLRQYQRAELKDFESELNAKPIDVLYVDPLQDDAILKSVLSNNTTFLVGRKGTGKSTIFAKAQSEIRKQKKVFSIYIDVKSLYEVISGNEIEASLCDDISISTTAFKAHLLRKTILGTVIAELLKELSIACDKLTLVDRWRGIKKQYIDLKTSLERLQKRLKDAKLEQQEIPILQKISKRISNKHSKENAKTSGIKSKAGVKLSKLNPEINMSAEGSLSDFDKTLDDNEIYDEYSDIVLRSFPYAEIFKEIQTVLNESGLHKLLIFFDDYSELKVLDQRLFVDVVLSPLNNSSNSLIKLKIAGYPGRIYYGKIDPSKADTLGLDFSDLFESNEIQEMERSAIDYTKRLLETRFVAFDTKVEDYFNLSTTNSMDDYYSILYKASFNVPRIIGHILHYCYLDSISKRNKITPSTIRLASKKYYEQNIIQYFERLNRYALEPFENKLDRHNQQRLLKCVIAEARSIRKSIIDKSIGGSYFEDVSNPPTSHFYVSKKLEGILSSLESNFFLSKYKNTRDKEGCDVSVYSLFFGLTESERMSWGYPTGRKYRNYFVQRCFDYNQVIHQYLSSNQTIKCNTCGTCFPLEQKDSLELYRWRCPECNEGKCAVVNLSDDFSKEVKELNSEIMLDQVEIEILETLNDENRKMRAGEISSLIDRTHQMIGRRTSILQESGLVKKTRDEDDGKMKSEITSKAKKTYFK